MLIPNSLSLRFAYERSSELSVIKNEIMMVSLLTKGMLWVKLQTLAYLACASLISFKEEASFIFLPQEPACHVE